MTHENREGRGMDDLNYDDLNYDELDPNIRKVVRLLRDHGFVTTDSGDGSKYPEMECAEQVANVYSTVRPADLTQACRDLYRIVSAAVDPVKSDWMVQGTYLPLEDVAIVELHGVTDDMLDAP